ncbi:hypothetical protein [Budvicia aquatica]|uniref:Uncharacterized protein n=1 Tax=Budvicia aquatica TaxID=82979 RepID=A0A2C6DK06_9GAMM|nr:hypothetical protein [Budvicia aquatica]PHI31566.1 hypothetical protein CRN84_20610 [Budvicia aquatica]VFS52080.1 Uncharacterised protein [Budvicia aquatica]
MVVKSEPISQAWHTLLAEINQSVDYHRSKVTYLCWVDRVCVVIFLIFLVLCGVWGFIYGLDQRLMAVFFAVSVGAFIVARRLSRQVRRHIDGLDQLILLQTWASGTQMTADNLTYLSQQCQRIGGKEPATTSNG